MHFPSFCVYKYLYQLSAKEKLLRNKKIKNIDLVYFLYRHFSSRLNPILRKKIFLLLFLFITVHAKIYKFVSFSDSPKYLPRSARSQPERKNPREINDQKHSLRILFFLYYFEMFH